MSDLLLWKYRLCVTVNSAGGGEDDGKKKEDCTGII